MNDELEEFLSISDITQYLIQHEKSTFIFETYKKLRLEKLSTDGYIILLMGYKRSILRVFESHLRIVVRLDEEGIQLILKQYNSNFLTYELSPGFYSIKDFSDNVYKMGDHKGTLIIEYDDISMKKKLVSTRFGALDQHLER